MTSEFVSDCQQEWEQFVRRSFEISDALDHRDARELLLSCFEGYLRENGWELAPRGVAQPIVDSLLMLEVTGNPGDPSFGTQNGAQRVIARGLSLIDPEELVYDARFEYPPEIIAATQQMLARIERHAREEPFGH
jgi:hypothetical protein